MLNGVTAIETRTNRIKYPVKTVNGFGYSSLTSEYGHTAYTQNSTNGKYDRVNIAMFQTTTFTSEYQIVHVVTNNTVQFKYSQTCEHYTAITHRTPLSKRRNEVNTTRKHAVTTRMDHAH